MSSPSSRPPKPLPDWSNLKFEYEDVEAHVRATWTPESGWSRPVVVEDHYVKVHVGATVFHYGQAVFEGLKAFRSRDDKIVLFRPEQNAQRLASSAERLMIPPVSEELFLEAVKEAVRVNARFVPPYGTGASLYIRPVIFGSGAVVGLKPSTEFLFLVIVTPVGGYYKADAKGASALIMDSFDRAAPKGLGAFKVAGNYAGALLPNQVAMDQGHPMTLYLDPLEHKYIEEFNSSNFVAVTKEGTYITPKSSSILPSITNKSLMVLARDENIKVEERQIDFAKEVETFAEVGAVGTAVIITPVSRIVHENKVHQIGEGSMGPILSRLFRRMNAIRLGEEEDKFGWMVEVKQ